MNNLPEPDSSKARALEEFAEAFGDFTANSYRTADQMLEARKRAFELCGRDIHGRCILRPPEDTEGEKT